MNTESIPDNPYLLLTPGPLSTTKTVKAAMLRDWCTWDDEYNAIVQQIRQRLIALAGADNDYTAVLMQGSGTFCVEATITTAVPRNGKLLVLANGAYGRRMARIAALRHRRSTPVQDSGELAPPDPDRLKAALKADPPSPMWRWYTVRPPRGCSTRWSHRPHRQSARQATLSWMP
jgi:2-aminoethylphosphonate-pyruvate transaminase